MAGVWVGVVVLVVEVLELVIIVVLRTSNIGSSSGEVEVQVQVVIVVVVVVVVVVVGGTYFDKKHLIKGGRDRMGFTSPSEIPRTQIPVKTRYPDKISFLEMKR